MFGIESVNALFQFADIAELTDILLIYATAYSLLTPSRIKL